PPSNIISRLAPLALLLFSFKDTANTEIYPLSLHDALPICGARSKLVQDLDGVPVITRAVRAFAVRGDVAQILVAVPNDPHAVARSEEHTSELQSPYDLVCRLLLEKKKTTKSFPRQVHALCN